MAFTGRASPPCCRNIRFELMTIKVMVADDHIIVRAGLKILIDGQGDMMVMGEAGTGEQVVSLASQGEWDVVLLDVCMPNGNGLDALEWLARSKPDIKVLVYSGLPEAQYGLSLMRAGANGFFSKERPLSDVAPAIRMVAAGGRYVSEQMEQLMVRELTEATVARPLHELLTNREFQVFVKLASGMRSTDICSFLELSAKTISTYRRQILTKMEMSCNADLTLYAIRNSIIG